MLIDAMREAKKKFTVTKKVQVNQSCLYMQNINIRVLLCVGDLCRRRGSGLWSDKERILPYASFCRCKIIFLSEMTS